jgi:hypothetical protein
MSHVSQMDESDGPVIGPDFETVSAVEAIAFKERVPVRVMQRPDDDITVIHFTQCRMPCFIGVGYVNLYEDVKTVRITATVSVPRDMVEANFATTVVDHNRWSFIVDEMVPSRVNMVVLDHSPAIANVGYTTTNCSGHQVYRLVTELAKAMRRRM